MKAGGVTLKVLSLSLSFVISLISLTYYKMFCKKSFICISLKQSDFLHQVTIALAIQHNFLLSIIYSSGIKKLLKNN